ncbi:N-acetylmuramoyl-L-alanine amidase [Dietzia cinnamea]|uniref:N-acetylmuramoyl-L-alanine amidase n=1 Tax=Dietzia cinnamea TaxID=321318 RepID=UPI00223A82AB|nr:N-acetylmuramoyl-L-alanine amidase [Dietzia cinnamea]MCT2061061.1 N-acetylmuramoyl-L-alanine amidase [Dietzia cinnamea]MCT2236218.1 N-acetylmuramoyl-L-alanine amidase [Dietzia cinnamea]MCT2299907.1 N-acetylmuramoyl-L-alanine amidase [Dietzia cinnamea]
MAWRRGDRGPEVAAIRATLAGMGLLHNIDSVGVTEPETGSVLARTDAVFDADLETAVLAFQQARGLISDGIVGPATQAALDDASHVLGTRDLSYIVSKPMAGDDVAQLQRRLGELGFYAGLVDGTFGALTHAAVTDFQRDCALEADGVVGAETLDTINRFSTLFKGGDVASLVEKERARTSGPMLAGKRIVLDPGPSGSENPIRIDTPYGTITDAELLWDITRRLSERMNQAGVEVFLSRPEAMIPTDPERAEIANAFNADLVISLRLDRHPNPVGNGVATFYFGNSLGAESMLGEALSGFIQREIVSRTELRDCRTHGRSWSLLRMTRMPSVQIYLGYAHNAGDLAILGDRDAQDTIIDSILVGVKRLYLLDEDDHPTGSMSVDDLIDYEQRQRS